MAPKDKIVLIICTGGTFAMETVKSGTLAPITGYLSNQIEKLEELSNKLMPSFDILEWDPAIDSCMMLPHHWIKITEQIGDNYFNYDGFVVLHGTDTMAYSASAVSFMLENLGKPVVFTGAQIPLSELFNDARRNLIMSMLIAANMDIPEVCICFNNSLLRANRTTKVDCWDTNAFESPNYPYLANLGIDIQVNRQVINFPPKNRFTYSTDLFTKVTVLYLVPGFDDHIIESFVRIDHGDVALVLACYGAGTAPIRKEGLLKVLKSAQNANVTLAIATQCIRGGLNLGLYESGQQLRDIGVIDSKDMTIEAVVTKLSYAMGKGLRGSDLKLFMETNLRGELTTKTESYSHSIDEICLPIGPSSMSNLDLPSKL